MGNDLTFTAADGTWGGNAEKSLRLLDLAAPAAMLAGFRGVPGFRTAAVTL
jgi:ribulose 1,5-bisphosphate carboxylase large subunit-like protein